MNEQGLDATIQMPEQASTLAPMVDTLYYQIFWISVAFFVAVVGAMVLFAWRYRRRKGLVSKPPGHHNALELFWTFSPLILLAYMFHQGFTGFRFMSVPPPNSINIQVRASKWRWEFEQPNGMTEGELTVPVHRPVRLIMGSVPTPPPDDTAVLHSFFVPAFRIKRDVVPGMYTSLWFEATRTGEFQVFCTEYCGTGHSRMLSKVHVVPQDEYECYLAHGPQRPEEFSTDAEWGSSIFHTSGGCTACHNTDPAQGVLVGPNLANVAGHPQPLEGGEEAMADAEYLRQSLREPQAHIVRGFTGASMPSFGGLPQSQIDALVAYLASISDAGEQVQTELGAGAEGGEGGGAAPCP